MAWGRRIATDTSRVEVGAPTSVAAPNPGRDASNPKQALFNVLAGTGLTLTLHGPGTLTELMTEALRLTPEFAQSKPFHQMFGEFPWDTETLWAGTTGSAGACIFVMVQPNGDAEAMVDKVAMPWGRDTQSPWAHEALYLGGPWSKELAQRFQVGEVVSVATLFGQECEAVPDRAESTPEQTQALFTNLEYWTRQENAHRLVSGEVSPSDLAVWLDEFLSLTSDRDLLEGLCERAMGASLMLGNPKEPTWDQALQLMMQVGRKHGLMA